MKVMIAGLLGGWEWIIVVLAVLLLFGAKRIPDLARSLGSSIREFKKGAREVSEEIQNSVEDKPQKPSPSQPSQTVSQSSNPPKV